MRKLSVLTALWLVACSGDSDSGGDPPANLPPETVEDTLARFNIDITQTPREDADGNPLPEDYSPLGSAAPIERFCELAVIGPRLVSDGENDVRAHVLKLIDDGNGRAEISSELYSERVANLSWLDRTGNLYRTAVEIDIDGDGLDEILFVYKEEANVRLQYRALDDSVASFATLDEGVLFEPGSAVSDLDLIAGDFDGNGWQDALLAVTIDEMVNVRFLMNDGSGRLSQATSELDIPDAQVGGRTDIRLATGNIDHDDAWEFGIVSNENSTAMSSRYVIYDDLLRDLAEMDSDSVRTTVGGVDYSALVGDITFGDVDGDGRDEVVIAGIQLAGTNIGGTQEFLMFALDDAVASFADLGSGLESDQYSGSSGIYQLGEVSVVHVNALDIDGDGAHEIQMSRFVFEDWFTAGPWSKVYEIPDGALVYDRQDQHADWTPDTSAIAVGDINSDGNEDIIVYNQSQGANYTDPADDPYKKGDVQVWGLSMVHGFTHLLRIDGTLEAGGSQTPRSPILLTPNVDTDSIAVRYSEGTYQLVFSEPIVVAALAAAPCSESLGQDVGACRTTYGEAETSSVTEENSQTISAEVHVGVKASGTLFGYGATSEVLGKVKEKSTGIDGTRHSKNIRVEHTTGPIEDSVLFISVPYDQYTYTILSHPDETILGEEIIVSLPRRPIEILATTSFYNENTPADAIKIDDSIFAHTPGDPSTYPTAADRASLLSRYDGFASDTIDVGQGSGDVKVRISIAEETIDGSSYDLGFSLDAKMTLGALVLGSSIGYSEGNTIKYTSGSETIYSGRVSNMSGDAFVDNAYSFGFMSYVYEHPAGPEFEVLNYWVE